MVLYATLLNTQNFKVIIKGKEEQSKEWSRSYWKQSLRDTLKQGHQLNFTYE